MIDFWFVLLIYVFDFRSEDAFFKRQGYPKASESFLPSTESPITVINGHINGIEPIKPRFNLHDCSYATDGANSSLGILNVENLSGR